MPGATHSTPPEARDGKSARRLAAHASRLSFFLPGEVSGEVRIQPGTCAFATCSAATSFTPPSALAGPSARPDASGDVLVFDRVLTTRTTSPRPSAHSPSGASLVVFFPLPKGRAIANCLFGRFFPFPEGRTFTNFLCGRRRPFL